VAWRLRGCGGDCAGCRTARTRAARGVGGLVQDEGAVEKLSSAGSDPALHDRVHARHPDTALDDLDTLSVRNGVEGGRVTSVPVPDQELHAGARVLKIHDHVSGELRDPCRGWMRGRAGDPDAPGGVLDHREGVQGRPGQCLGLEEVGGEDGVGLGAQERGSGGAVPLRCGVDAVLLEDIPQGGGGDLDAEGGELAVDTPVPPTGVVVCEPEHQVRGRSGRLGRETLAWRWRSRSRCRRSSVSGEAINWSRRSCTRGRGCWSAARGARSGQVRCGLSICLCYTAGWWRSAKISASFVRLRRDQDPSAERCTARLRAESVGRGAPYGTMEGRARWV
jgi:hypothetical protein